MTRRLVAAAVLAGSVALVASPAVANHNDAEFCVGGDSRQQTGRMIGYCFKIDNPLDRVGT